MNKKAFTLIELLVVIAIVGIVAGIITPVIGRAREGSRRSQCNNNLRQFGIAIHLYVDDNDFLFPPVWYSPGGMKFWYRDYLAPYIDDTDVWRCPTYKYHDYTDTHHFSYGFNGTGLNTFIDVTTGNRGNDINTVRYPTRCIMVMDGGRGDADGTDESWYRIDVSSKKPRVRHSNGANILFMDGHVNWHLLSEVPLSGADKIIWWNY